MPSFLSPSPLAFSTSPSLFYLPESPPQSILAQSISDHSKSQRRNRKKRNPHLSKTQQGKLVPLAVVEIDSKHFIKSTEPVDNVNIIDTHSSVLSNNYCGLPRKEKAGVVQTFKMKGRFSSKDVGSFNLAKENGGAPTTGKLEDTERNENLPTGDDVDILASVGRLHVSDSGERIGSLPITGKVEKFDSIMENVRECTEQQLKVVDFVKENEVPMLDSVEKDGREQILDFTERTRRSTVGERVDFINSFKKEAKFPTQLFDFNNFLVALVEAGETESAVNLFSKLPSCDLSPDSRTFSIMVQCFCKRNEPDEARRVLDKMLECGFRPNVITYTILINAFCKRGRLQKAYEIFEIMGQTGCAPTVRTYNCLVSGLCFVGRVEEAYQLLMKIKKSSKKPDIYTYTAVMDGFCKVGRSDEGMEMLEEAEKMGLKPTVVTYNTLFNGYCKEGRPLEGIRVLKVMEEKSCQPDFISYCTLLHGLLKWNEIYAGLDIYKEMTSAGFEVDGRMMNTLLIRICRKSLEDEEMLKDAEELFERMKESQSVPTPYTYCWMIQALAVRGYADKALGNLQEMIRIGYAPRPVTYNAVIRILCIDGRVNDAWLVLFIMIQSRKFPSKISYNLLLDEFNQQGRFLDACKLYAVALKSGIVPHQKPIDSLDDEELGKEILDQKV